MFLGKVLPRTENQSLVFDSYMSGKHLLMTGMAGTGKTFTALYLGLKDVELGIYDQVRIIRSVVPTRDPGFLPGTLKEKTRIYENPYFSVCAELYDRGDAYDILKQRGSLDFTTTSFVRGMTFNDCVIVIDEIQNMKFHEIDSIVTRVGKNCRLICCGDYRQSDLIRNEEKKGVLDFTRVAKTMDSFDVVEFGYDDILRSDLVREFLIARDRLGIET